MRISLLINLIPWCFSDMKFVFWRGHICMEKKSGFHFKVEIFVKKMKNIFKMFTLFFSVHALWSIVLKQSLSLNLMWCCYCRSLFLHSPHFIPFKKSNPVWYYRHFTWHWKIPSGNYLLSFQAGLTQTYTCKNILFSYNRN